MTELSVGKMSVSMGEKRLIDDISFSVPPGEITVLLGPNGAGKSMSLRAMLGLVPCEGETRLGTSQLSAMSASERARHIAYLPQNTPLAWPVRVRDVVALGRFSYGSAVGRLSRDDDHAVQMALSECGLETMADRQVDTLSGGEIARVHCARAFAGRTAFLLADEPVAALDPAQAFHIMDLLRAKARRGLGVLVVLHDIALAARYADRMILMKAGRINAQGPTEAVLSEAAIGELYGVSVTINGRQVVTRPSNVTV